MAREPVVLGEIDRLLADAPGSQTDREAQLAATGRALLALLREMRVVIDRAMRETASSPEDRYARNATIMLSAALALAVDGP